MKNYIITTANGKHSTVKADSTKNALIAALDQGCKLPIIAEPTTGTGERLVMPDVSKGRFL